MNVLVAYATHHGATREIAERIARVLGERGLTVSVESVDRVRDAGEFEAFVVGSALYCGWLKEAMGFVERNKKVLAAAPMWLFSSGPLGGEHVDAQGRDVLENAAPKELARLREWIGQREHRVFFGAYDPNAKPVGFLERTFRLVPNNAAILAAGDFRDWADIEAWARAIGDRLAEAPTRDTRFPTTVSGRR
jgi:menaquinone-dependent protoporphyrinogen oxidase